MLAREPPDRGHTLVAGSVSEGTGLYWLAFPNRPYRPVLNASVGAPECHH
jgi:hypothetical protein